MNHEELEYIQGLEKRLAELEAKKNRNEGFLTTAQENVFRTILNHTKRLQDLESQVCGAKKGRMDNLEDKIDTLQIRVMALEDESCLGKIVGLKERLENVEKKVYPIYRVEQPDRTVTSKPTEFKAGESLCDHCQKTSTCDMKISCCSFFQSKSEEKKGFPIICEKCGYAYHSFYEHKCPPSGEKKWKPKDNDLVWHINLPMDGVHQYIYFETSNMNGSLNVFRTREEAESFLSKIKALREE